MSSREHRKDTSFKMWQPILAIFCGSQMPRIIYAPAQWTQHRFEIVKEVMSVHSSVSHFSVVSTLPLDFNMKNIHIIDASYRSLQHAATPIASVFRDRKTMLKIPKLTKYP